MLFSHLPDDLFKPLASPSRAFNAALLLHLRAGLFAETVEPLRKSEVLAAIGDFCIGWSVEAIRDDETLPVDATERRSALYRRFLDTGWLVERRERYVPVVDLDPKARALLDDLARLDRGETRSYGGAVLDVLGALESATANPGERSEALGNAARAARGFLEHLGGLAGALRQVEERILAEADLRDAVRLYFEEFVERHLVRDYRTLHTRFNPFRFRSRIVREAGRALRDPLTLRALAEGSVREGRAGDLGAAERAVRAELAEILSVFEGLDRHLDAVSAVVARLERRIGARLAYAEPRDSGRIERVAAALRAIGAARDLSGAPPPPVLGDRPAIGPPHLSTPRRRRQPLPPDPLPETEIDAGVAAFAAAKDAFRRRTSVGLQAVVALLERHLAGNVRIRGADLPIADIDAFVVFQRLREIDVLFDGALRARYRVVRGPGRISNGWLDCPDFRIERAVEGFPGEGFPVEGSAPDA